MNTLNLIIKNLRFYILLLGMDLYKTWGLGAQLHFKEPNLLPLVLEVGGSAIVSQDSLISILAGID